MDDGQNLENFWFFDNFNGGKSIISKKENLRESDTGTIFKIAPLKLCKNQNSFYCLVSIVRF